MFLKHSAAGLQVIYVHLGEGDTTEVADKYYFTCQRMIRKPCYTYVAVYLSAILK